MPEKKVMLLLNIMYKTMFLFKMLKFIITFDYTNVTKVDVKVNKLQN